MGDLDRKVFCGTLPPEIQEMIIAQRERTLEKERISNELEGVMLRIASSYCAPYDLGLFDRYTGINTGLIRSLTGSDSISASTLYGAPGGVYTTVPNALFWPARMDLPSTVLAYNSIDSLQLD